MSDRANQDDGGPAFPGIEGQDGHGNCTRHVQHDLSVSYVTHNQGMSLRDWFAGMALQAILSNPDCIPPTRSAVQSAYGMANSMLAERSKSQ